MRSNEELTELFTTYFGDRLSTSQIDALVADVTASTRDRQARTLAATAAAIGSQRAALWSAALAQQ
jgi:hypothetical protein